MTPKDWTNRSMVETSELDAASELRRLERHDPLLRAVAAAPEDDEPFTAADAAALAQVDSDRARGRRAIPFEEVMRKQQRK